MILLLNERDVGEWDTTEHTKFKQNKTNHLLTNITTSTPIP